MLYIKPTQSDRLTPLTHWIKLSLSKDRLGKLKATGILNASNLLISFFLLELAYV
jgi:hypothetical protein